MWSVWLMRGLAKTEPSSIYVGELFPTTTSIVTFHDQPYSATPKTGPRAAHHGVRIWHERGYVCSWSPIAPMAPTNPTTHDKLLTTSRSLPMLSLLAGAARMLRRQHQLGG